MAVDWSQVLPAPSLYAGQLPYRFLCTSYRDVRIEGISVSIHKTADGKFFIGARSAVDESSFPPRFQPSLKAAKVYVELMKD